MADEQLLAGYAVKTVFRGTGAVRSYRATMPDARDVLVKVVDTDPTTAARMVAWLGSLMTLGEGAVERIIERGQTPTGYYVVREWVAGTHLGTRPLPENVEPKQRAAYVAAGLRGLADIHRAGLVHGDVRPSNFVVASDGSVRIVDVGIPTAAPGGQGSPPSSAYYTSPEEVSGQWPTYATDIYRSGLVLYELLAGRVPFDGADGAAVAQAHLYQPALPPSGIDARSPEALDAVVARALAKNPADRYPTADAFADDIEAAVAPKRGWLLFGVIAGVLIALLALGLLLDRATTATVPRVVGMSSTAAAAQLASEGFEVGSIGREATMEQPPDTVLDQSPAAGAEARKGSAVDIVVAEVVTVTVPDVQGKTETDATSELQGAGLDVGDVERVNDAEIEKDVVISQTPAASTEVTQGTEVDLRVSLGPESKPVPNVIGFTESEAESALTDAGFVAKATEGYSASFPKGEVATQSPPAGADAEVGSTVTIQISKGAEPSTAPPATTPPPSTSTTQPSTQDTETASGGSPSEPSEPPAGDETPAAIKVPDLVGSGIISAWFDLWRAGLQLEIAGVEKGDFLNVVRQEPVAQTEVEEGAVVSVWLGLPWLPEPSEPEPTPLPSEPSSPKPAPLPTPEPAPQPSPPATGSPSQQSSDTTTP